jgi:hypothetical protein
MDGYWMKENEWFLDENKGVNILDESNWVDFGRK